MAFRTYQLAVTATPQRLSTVLSDPTRGGKVDEAFLQLSITMDTNPAFLGMDNTVSSSNFGYEVFPMTATAWQVCEIGPFVSGPIKLSDIWVVGTSGTLHIMGIPF